LRGRTEEGVSPLRGPPRGGAEQRDRLGHTWDWPGDTAIRAADLGLEAPDRASRIEDMSLEEVESLLIRKALARHGRNVSRAAEALELSRSALYRRMQRFGL
jgi:DNA-binding NtrC family response regulator